MSFTITVEHQADTTVLHLAGELDLDASGLLNARIDQLVAGGEHRLVLALHQLTFCDSTGMSAFIRGDNACAERGGWLRLIGQNGHVADVLTMVGLTDALRYQPDEQAAAGH